MNGKWSRAFALSRSDRQDCPPSVLLNSLLLESLLYRLRHNSCSPDLHVICLPRRARARVSANADEVSTFVSCHKYIEVLQRTTEQHEKLMEAKINRNKSYSLRLIAWKYVALLGPFRWTDDPDSIFGVWFEPDLHLEKNCSDLQRNVGVAIWTWLRTRLSLAQKYSVYIFPIFIYCTSSL